MGGDWPVKTVAECASSEPYSTQIGPFGKALMADEYKESGVPVLRGVNVNRGRFHDDDFVFIDDETADRLSKFESYRGDVLLVHKGTLGQIGLMPSKRKYHRYIMGNSMMRVRCDPAKLLPEYLYYWLSSAEGQHYLFSRVSQVGVPQLQTPLTTLRQAALPVPSLPEQRAIAHILGTLDDKIELNRRMNDTLEAIARTLFKSWFVDFDPVRTKVEGRDPGLPKPLADLFPDSFEDSELGEIPQGWRVANLGDLCRRVAMGPFGSDIKTDNFVESGVPVVRGGNLTRGFVDEGFVFVSEAKADELRNANAFPGDIVVTHRGTLGQVGLVPVPSRFPRYVVSQSQMLLSMNPDLATPRYVCEFLRSPAGQYALLANTSQTGVPAIARPTSSLRAIRILQPPIPTLANFERILGSLIERGNRSAEETRALASLRDTLLPKLISGDLRIENAERITGGVTWCRK